MEVCSVCKPLNPVNKKRNASEIMHRSVRMLEFKKIKFVKYSSLTSQHLDKPISKNLEMFGQELVVTMP
uniref:Uncharacterized protein n=1 Tax=Meloidogyne enterolobii TaxID=390850 RepID=A0A6V7XYE2_MELEN|nr:unnamed protein product [Meloidogyne enterolobii]